MSEAGTVTCNSVELTKVGVRRILGKLIPTFSIGFPAPFCVNPVPFMVRVNAEPPEATEGGLRLVIVSGALVVLKFAYTSDSSVGDKVSGFIEPLRSQLQPVKVQGEPPVFGDGVAVYVNIVPDG
jgi:hypothetical protein